MTRILEALHPEVKVCRAEAPAGPRWVAGMFRRVALGIVLFAPATAVMGETVAVASADQQRRQEQQRRRRIPVRLLSPGESRIPDTAGDASTADTAPAVQGPTDAVPPLTNPAEALPSAAVGDDAGLGERELLGNGSGSRTGRDTSGIERGGNGLAFGFGAASTATTAAELALDGKRVTATPTATAPVLDGFVDDEVWSAADVVTDFVQKDPVGGAPPSQRTEVRLLYDEDNLYFGLVFYDDEPDKIVATDLRRDGWSESEDGLAIYLDTFHDHRTAFTFSVNPLGRKFDAILRDESQFNTNWDESWETAAQITERGWEAEVVIPFAILRYPPGSHVWGVEFQRDIGRTKERINWNNTSRDHDWRAVSQAGHLVGLQDLKLTDRFRFKPFVSGAYNSLQQRSDPLSDGDGDFGIEVFKVQVTPNLTANLTVNTDFAQVEADDQQINLTRFSLFFPEKREFFLEAANSFTFGTLARRGATEGGSGAGFSRQPPLALLFFSRRIGLGPDGEPLPIRFGGKLTGKVGGGNLGFVNVQTSDFLFGVGKNYSALRWKQDVLDRSSIGALVTNVQGPNGEFNRVFGLDADFTFFDHLFVSGFIASGHDDAIDGTSLVGQFGAGWDTDKWGVSGDVTYVADDFDTDLGFVLRQDIVRQSYQGRWSTRPSWEFLRRASFSGLLEYITDTSGRLVSRRAGVNSAFELDSGDWVTFRIDRNFERLEFDFPIDENVGIPIGDYSWTDAQIGFRRADRQWLGGRVRLNLGEFYDGTRFGIGGGPRIRFSQRFSLQPEYNYNHIRLPRGAFSTHLVRARANLYFSDRVLIDSLLQHSSVTDQLSVFARLRYIYRTGDDFYIVYRQSTAFEGLFDGFNDRSLTAKMTYAFQW